MQPKQDYPNNPEKKLIDTDLSAIMNRKLLPRVFCRGETEFFKRFHSTTLRTFIKDSRRMFTNHKRLGCNPFCHVMLLRLYLSSVGYRLELGIPVILAFDQRAAINLPALQLHGHNVALRFVQQLHRDSQTLAHRASLLFLPLNFSGLHQELLLFNFYDSRGLISLVERFSSRVKVLS